MAGTRLLPPHLATRVHAPGGEAGPSPRPGSYVLYWMRTAARGHDNPALDVARSMSRELGIPFFVYHGLSERYPYASDRHHRFILEGARDVEAEFARQGIGYAFHLERPGQRGAHLRLLAHDAALLVTEDMPVTPLSTWTGKLAEEVPLWAVDTACLAPMRLVPPDRTHRAFRFREAVRDGQRRWLHEPWPALDPGPSTEAFLPRLPFQPLRLAGADLSGLIATCRIDHSVGPIPHTPGGSRAGYARWAAFREVGLERYADQRNDPLKPGVSRMSAYLHYGHVSPFRIAREAAVVGGRGATKYLDELLIWREMAYGFCAHHPNHATVAGIPEWARSTLRQHEADPRDPLSWERMARGRTGDSLWDAAQRSLLIHGELHNNARMTWGKAILGWTRTMEDALDRMVDLNHRYALDGRDPASYGGLLWCLGQFDRPFSPEQPVFGAVRSRSTGGHARRLDVAEYGERTARPAWENRPRVAVVGAGLSGLMSARILADHGLEVTVFDKGRRPGGRANTREHGAHRFDHGAQFFTIRDPRLRPYLNSWIQEGVVAEWKGRLARIRGGVLETAKPDPRYVGDPGMIRLAEHLGGGARVESGRRIESARRGGTGWVLTDADGNQSGEFDWVLVAVPAPQAVALLEEVPRLRESAASVEMAPCWAGLFAFSDPLPLPFDGAFVEGGPISWLARDGSKPGRAPGERWVVHATPGWTRAHLGLERDVAAEEILAAFRAWSEGSLGLGDALPTPTFQRAHRWGYALATEPLLDGCLVDADAGIGVCGDWCLGGRVEGALLSGAALAGRILGQASADPGNPLGDSGQGRSGPIQWELALP